MKIGKLDVGSPNYMICRGLWTCLVNSWHIHKGFVIQLNHSQPSGNPWTTIINTIYNRALLETSILFSLSEKQCALPSNIMNLFKVFVYGDDNFIVCSDWLTTKLSPMELSSFLQSTGHSYTAEDKSEQKEYRSLDQISILKRKFNVNTSLSYVFAPLDETVFIEILNWDKEKNYQKKIEQLFTNATTVYHELLHHSQEVFDLYWNQMIYPELLALDFDGSALLPYEFARMNIASRR
nr:MAG: RNA-dependent RNA polymerase [Riboviria sp.]